MVGCRQSDEQSLFTCLDRQEAGDSCCSQSKTAECMQSCKDIFRTRFTPTKEQRYKVIKACENDDHKVLQCLKNLIDDTQASNLKICKCFFLIWRIVPYIFPHSLYYNSSRYTLL